jgi:phosphate transport system substrate-binding protein
MTVRLWAVLAAAGALAVATVSGCSSKNENAIKITGSDTMVNLAQAWAEGFRGDHPDVSLQIKGGGSGMGIAALCAGKIQIATASAPAAASTAQSLTVIDGPCVSFPRAM